MNVEKWLSGKLPNGQAAFMERKSITKKCTRKMVNFLFALLYFFPDLICDFDLLERQQQFVRNNKNYH